MFLQLSHRRFAQYSHLDRLRLREGFLDMIIAWFSCGATSAVACKIALQKYSDVHIYYIETGSAHPDNERFIKECELWFGKSIIRVRSKLYSNVDEVLLSRRYINSPSGAPCTFFLKKKVRAEIEDEIRCWEGQVWGFDYCRREINRAIRFKQQNPKTKPIFPLIDCQISKSDAMAILQRVGIKIPFMYQLGYNNNNCIGCVKGGIGYWNKIRIDFPERFQKMAEIERKINATCISDDEGKVYLDELDPKRGKQVSPIIPECSIVCDIEFADIIDSKTQLVLDGELDMKDIL